MNERERVLNEFLRKYKEKDILGLIEDYKIFNQTLIKFIDTLHSKKVAPKIWQPYFETHLFKFSLISASLIREFEGTKIKSLGDEDEVKTFNISALYLLARAQIETFFLIKY